MHGKFSDIFVFFLIACLMFQTDFETLTYDLCKKFRKDLRTCLTDIQDICYSYRNEKNQDTSFWITAANDINWTMRNYLNINTFSERRKPIEEYRPKLDSFKSIFQTNRQTILTQTLAPIQKNSTSINLPSNAVTDFDDLKKWEELETTLRKNKTKVNSDIYEQCSNSVIRGKAISRLITTFSSLDDFYRSLPKAIVTQEDRENYLLRKENEMLKRNLAIKEKQIKQLIEERTSLREKLKRETDAHKEDTKILASLKSKADDKSDLLRQKDQQINDLRHNYDSILQKNEEDESLFRKILELAEI